MFTASNIVQNYFSWLYRNIFLVIEERTTQNDKYTDYVNSEMSCETTSLKINEPHDKLPLTSHTDANTSYSKGFSDFNCFLCGRYFKTQKNLKGHKCSYCSACGKIFSDFRRYKGHKCTNSKNSEASHVDTGNHKANRNFLHQL